MADITSILNEKYCVSVVSSTSPDSKDMAEVSVSDILPNSGSDTDVINREADISSQNTEDLEKKVDNQKVGENKKSFESKESYQDATFTLGHHRANESENDNHILDVVPPGAGSSLLKAPNFLPSSLSTISPTVELEDLQTEQTEDCNSTVPPVSVFSKSSKSSKASITSKLTAQFWSIKRHKSLSHFSNLSGRSPSLGNHPEIVTSSQSSTLSTASPKNATLSYSPSLYSVAYKKSFKRQKIIEELMETEASYIEFLKLLGETFVTILEGEGLSKLSKIPLKAYVDILISEHRSFLREMQQLQITSGKSLSRLSLHTASPQHHLQIPSSGIDQLSDRFFLNYSSPTIAAYIGKLVSKKALNLYIYTQYFSLFDIISKLLERLDAKDYSLRKGVEKFLEAIQSDEEKNDLSFLSLLQKPAARLGKYRLLVESLLATMPENDRDTQSLKASLSSIKTKLSGINNFSSDIEQKDVTKTLLNNIIFEQPVGFPIECLGLPILCGALASVWRTTSGALRSRFYGMFLFKSTLLCCRVDKSTRYVVKFMIPLSCCRIEPNAATDGLYCSYQNTFKVVFEHNFAVYEMMLTGFRKHEVEIWKTKLEVLVNFVNGPYEFDYSASLDGCNLTTALIPSNLAPVDVSLNRFNEVDYNFSHCYFGELVAFKLHFVSHNSSHTNSGDASPSNLPKNKSLKHSALESATFLHSAPHVIFRKQALAVIKKRLGNVWSSELHEKQDCVIKTIDSQTCEQTCEQTGSTSIDKSSTIRMAKTRNRSFQHLRSGTIRFSASVKRSYTNSTDLFTPTDMLHSRDISSQPRVDQHQQTTTPRRELLRRASRVFNIFAKQEQRI